MHFEIRKKKGKKIYYLAHSVKHQGKVRKARKYLGIDLHKDEGKLDEARKAAEPHVKKKVAEIKQILAASKDKGTEQKERNIKTGIESFDKLFNAGIPKGSSVIIAGSPGTGKTILTLQLANSLCLKGQKVLYISFEESKERLFEHMEGFGWDPGNLVQKGLFYINRADPFRLARTVEGLLAKAKGEMLIEIGAEGIVPRGFKPDIIILDSISALSSAFVSGGDSYRIYIEQLFRFFEKMGVTSFLISETEDAPKKLSESGVEEFLADGVVVMYYLKKGNVRERAIEVLKMRGAKHQEKVAAMQITEKGIVIYPEQEVFGETEK